jgi:septal ring factor EnvC (AmiA/AmiB activator)
MKDLKMLLKLGVDVHMSRGQADATLSYIEQLEKERDELDYKVRTLARELHGLKTRNNTLTDKVLDLQRERRELKEKVEMLQTNLMHVAETWRSEYINELRSHIRFSNRFYAGELEDAKEGSILNTDAVINDSVEEIESKLRQKAKE